MSQYLKVQYVGILFKNIRKINCIYLQDEEKKGLDVITSLYCVAETWVC